MKILIVILILWSIFNTFLSITAILGGFNNHKDIEVIKSWYPFCDIFKTRIPKKKGSDTDCGAKMENKEYLDKTFPEHDGGEWFDITDMITRESKE